MKKVGRKCLPLRVIIILSIFYLPVEFNEKSYTPKLKPVWQKFHPSFKWSVVLSRLHNLLIKWNHLATFDSPRYVTWPKLYSTQNLREPKTDPKEAQIVALENVKNCQKIQKLYLLKWSKWQFLRLQNDQKLISWFSLLNVTYFCENSNSFSFL